MLQKYCLLCPEILFPVTQTFVFGQSWLLFGDAQLFLSKANPRCSSSFSLVQGLLTGGAMVETVPSFLPPYPVPTLHVFLEYCSKSLGHTVGMGFQDLPYISRVLCAVKTGFQ